MNKLHNPLMRLAKDDLDHIGAMFAMEGEKWRDELRAGFAAYDRGNRIDAARYRPLPLYGNQVTWNGAGRLVGWSLRAVGGPVTVELVDGHDAVNGDTFASLQLSADGATATQWFGPGGISFTEALYTVVTLGTGATSVRGAIYLGAVD